MQINKPEIRRHERAMGGVLILDDSIEEKPYTDENEIVAWHHSHAKRKFTSSFIDAIRAATNNLHLIAK